MRTGVIIEDVLANRPPAGRKGRFFHATDTGEVHLDTGSVWTAMGGGGGGGGLVVATAALTNDTASALGTYEQWGTEVASVPDPGREVDIIARLLGAVQNTSAALTRAIAGVEFSTDGGATWRDNGGGATVRPATANSGADFVLVAAQKALFGVTPTGGIQVRGKLYQYSNTPGDVTFMQGQIVLEVI